jgi:hypothetical protein
MTISKKVDLTKPISIPAGKGKWVLKGGILPSKVLTERSFEHRSSVKR